VIPVELACTDASPPVHGSRGFRPFTGPVDEQCMGGKRVAPVL